MAVDPHAPLIIGVAQRTWREPPAPEPLEMWATVVREAVDDVGTGGALGAVDSLQVVYCMSWPYDDPVARLAASLGIAPRHRFYSGIGGTTPQVLVNDTAEAILRGELDLAVIVGGEALNTKRVLKKAAERPAWSHRHPEKQQMPFEAMPHASEMSHGVWQAYTTFALNDIARRARLGTTPDDHRRSIGELFAPMTSVAAANEHAWFPFERSAAELVEPTADNRMVSYPYTKYTIAVMDVDMAGALVLTSHAKADALGVPPDRRVYLRGWAYGNDPWYPAAREDLSRSPAIRAVAAATLDQVGAGIDDVAHLDLYSCFSSSVTIACDELGIDPLGDRDLTVTGGLPFAGGPASNYLLHSVATMADRLRADPGALGVVSGVGMHLTKHVYAAYSTEPGPLSPPDAAALEARLEAEPQREIVDRYTGTAEVVSYTVQHSRDRGPERAVIVAELSTGERCYATATDPDLLAALETEEHVGRKLDLAPQDDVNIARA